MASLPPTTDRKQVNRTIVRPDAIPKELRCLKQWVVWRWEQRGDKWTKPPYNPHTGEKAKVNDSRTWGTFDEAHQAYLNNADFDGIGFVFTKADPFAGVDLDDCRNPETGEIEPWAQEFVDLLDSCTEISPSGTGVKVWVKGTVPKGRKKSYRGGAVEVYDRDHYFTVTGWHL